MANVIAIHIDGNGQYKYNLNAGYMLSYVVANNHKGKFFIGKSDISVADSAKQIISENPDCIIFTFAKYNHYISIALSKELKISALTVKKAYDSLESEGFTATIHGKGTYVTAANTELLLEEQRKEVEADLEMAIQKGRRCGISDEDIRSLFELILEG